MTARNCGKILDISKNKSYSYNKCWRAATRSSNINFSETSSRRGSSFCQRSPLLVRTSSRTILFPHKPSVYFYHHSHYCTSIENQKIDNKLEDNYIKSCEESVNEETREDTQFMGWDALHWAAFKGDNQMVKEIIQNRKKSISETDLQQVFKQDLVGVSPLHLAVERGHADVVDTLLAQGCDPNVRDIKPTQRLSALHLAVRRNNIDINIIKSLIQHKANVNQEAIDKKTPLFRACAVGRNDVVDILVKNGAKLNIQDNPKTSGWGAYRVTTPLHSAVSGGFHEVVTTLLENGADVNYNLRDDVGESPLHVAALMGRLQVAQILLKFSANVNSLDCFGATPLDYAKSGGDESKDVVQLLVEHGGKDGKGRRL